MTAAATPRGRPVPIGTRKLGFSRQAFSLPNGPAGVPSGTLFLEATQRAHRAFCWPAGRESRSPSSAGIGTRNGQRPTVPAGVPLVREKPSKTPCGCGSSAERHPGAGAERHAKIGAHLHSHWHRPFLISLQTAPIGRASRRHPTRREPRSLRSLALPLAPTRFWTKTVSNHHISPPNELCPRAWAIHSILQLAK